MKALAQNLLDDDRREAAPAGVRGRRLDTPAQVRRKVRAGAVRANWHIGGFRRPGLGRELGRNAAADYSEEKTFHVHNGPRAHWRLAPGLSTERKAAAEPSGAAQGRRRTESGRETSFWKARQ
jgi:hypothetical protein